MNPPTLYVIATCDRCRSAIRWLRTTGKPFLIHDLRSDGVPPERLDDWLSHWGPEKLLNRTSTTWRNLDPVEKESLDPERIRALLLKHPTLIRRPLLETDQGRAIGFDPLDFGRYL